MRLVHTTLSLVVVVSLASTVTGCLGGSPSLGDNDSADSAATGAAGSTSTGMSSGHEGCSERCDPELSEPCSQGAKPLCAEDAAGGCSWKCPDQDEPVGDALVNCTTTSITCDMTPPPCGVRIPLHSISRSGRMRSRFRGSDQASERSDEYGAGQAAGWVSGWGLRPFWRRMDEPRRVST